MLVSGLFVSAMLRGILALGAAGVGHVQGTQLPWHSMSPCSPGVQCRAGERGWDFLVLRQPEKGSSEVQLESQTMSFWGNGQNNAFWDAGA